MTIIKSKDLIDSVEDALQFISYYHPKDFIDALYQAYLNEESKAAKDAMSQILVNSKMSAEGKRPICQDTGIVTCFVKVGMDVRWDSKLSLQEMIDEGVRKAYLNPDNPLRASIVSEPAGRRLNTKDNTPSVVHVELIPGNTVTVYLAAKGGGSENKSKLVMLNPSDDIVETIAEIVPKMGAGWCPPGVLGIGIGGTAEKAAVLAKESLLDHININNLSKKDVLTDEEQLRLDIYNKVNSLGIGAQGLGGLTTVLDVKIKSAPTHAASKPLCIIPNCAATRHIHFTLDGQGKASLPKPNLNDWPEISMGQSTESKRVNLNNITKQEIESWVCGETLLISGKILTGRDAAHKRLLNMWESGEEFPKNINFENKFIYYVGPVDAVGDEVVGPAGPTTSTRMDKFTDFMLEKLKISGMIGKAERGPKTVDSIKRNKSVYLMAVGGAAYLVSKAIKSAKVVAFPDLGMEAIYEFEVDNMPVTVAVDTNGENIHEKGPGIWKIEIEKMNQFQQK